MYIPDEYPWGFQEKDEVKVSIKRKDYYGTITAMKEKFHWGGNDGIRPRVAIDLGGGHVHVADHVGRPVDQEDGTTYMQGRVTLIVRPGADENVEAGVRPPADLKYSEPKGK